MIVPSIDLMGGRTVQLVGGSELALEAGAPRQHLERFARVGEVAVIDIDAARGEGTNAGLIEPLCAAHPVRVGGGIRDERAAHRWLDAGARRIIIGTAATPGFLARLPRERLIVALDAQHGEVVVDGWRTRTGARVTDRMRELRDHCSGFLVTFVEREGRLGGTDIGRVAELVDAAGPARVTIAGGVTSAAEVASLDALGADAQVGMALYTGRMSLAEAFLAPTRSDREDGLIPTVVADESGVALGLVYSSRESVARSLDSGRGVYCSRRRGLWEKGATSGAVQELVRIELDCDRDALRFTVRQRGAGFCHRATASCWGGPQGLAALEARIARATRAVDPQGYTQRLLSDAALLEAKLLEEAHELATARGAGAVAHEAADLLYFTAVALARAEVPLQAALDELDRRARRVTRRAGDAKAVRA
jgi:phosphoribosyl-ATP pyrophosphohydrolase